MEQNTSTVETERLFNQDEVNNIVKDRLTRERAKIDAEFAEKESDLVRREKELADKIFSMEAENILEEMGLPYEVTGLITTRNKDEFKTACAKLQKIIKMVNTPNIKGETPYNGKHSLMSPDARLDEIMK